MGLAAWAADPFSGTWKRNLAHSTSSSRVPMTSLTQIVEIVGSLLTITSESSNAAGEAKRETHKYNLDGEATSLGNSSALVRRFNDHLIEFTITSDQGRARRTMILSPDGKKMVWINLNSNAQGTTSIANYSLYERQ